MRITPDQKWNYNLGEIPTDVSVNILTEDGEIYTRMFKYSFPKSFTKYKRAMVFKKDDANIMYDNIITIIAWEYANNT